MVVILGEIGRQVVCFSSEAAQLLVVSGGFLLGHRGWGTLSLDPTPASGLLFAQSVKVVVVIRRQVIRQIPRL